jgi:antitoxin MazE
LYTTIQKWGNSHGIRIPKQLLDALDLHESDKVEIERHQDMITIRKAGFRHRTLEERLAEFKGTYEFTECETGTPVGNEVG